MRGKLDEKKTVVCGLWFVQLQLKKHVLMIVFPGDGNIEVHGWWLKGMVKTKRNAYMWDQCKI
jgi:hypothetical protein